jgi:hypothetical protein
MPDHGERMTALEVRREHVGLEPLNLRRGTVLVVVLIVVGSAIEIEGTFVFIRLAVLCGRHVSRRSSSNRSGKHTQLHRCTISRMLPDENW